MGVERRGEKWVARLVHGDSRYLVGVFGSDGAARIALDRAKADLAAGSSPLVGPAGTMSGQAFAASIGVRYGTVKRWTSEGMPVHRSNGLVHVDPDKANAWIDANRKDTIALLRASTIYVARRSSDGAFKIGWSSDVARRIQELRKLTRSEVALVVAFPGDKPDELRLHERFAADRIDGEWFRASAALAAFVDGVRGAAA